MSFPKFAEEIINDKNIPTYDNSMKCDGIAQFGDLTFVIGGREYPLSNDDWMYPEMKQ